MDPKARWSRSVGIVVLPCCGNSFLVCGILASAKLVRSIDTGETRQYQWQGSVVVSICPGAAPRAIADMCCVMLRAVIG